MLTLREEIGMSRETKNKDQTASDVGGGKFLTFVLAEEEYGIEILSVREIIGLLPVTPVPQSPYYVKGVVNLRGQVIPVVDLRLKFDMEAIDATDETCIIVVQTGGVQLGIIVDKVSEVLDIHGDDIVDAPTLGTEINTDYIMGIGKSEGRVTLLLDIGRVFPSQEVSEMAA
jgi:purine-binding chemotaxis protein CheW